MDRLSRISDVDGCDAYTLQVVCAKAAIHGLSLCVVAGFVTVYANQTATFQGSAAPEGQVDTARCRKTMLCTHMCASVKVVEVIYLKGIWLGCVCRSAKTMHCAHVLCASPW